MHLVKLLRLKRLLCSLQMVAASQLFTLLALVSRSEETIQTVSFSVLPGVWQYFQQV